MTEEIYIGKATFEDGQECDQEGTIKELSNWADNIIRLGGICNIEIRIKKWPEARRKKVRQNEVC